MPMYYPPQCCMPGSGGGTTNVLPFTTLPTTSLPCQHQQQQQQSLLYSSMQTPGFLTRPLPPMTVAPMQQSIREAAFSAFKIDTMNSLSLAPLMQGGKKLAGRVEREEEPSSARAGKRTRTDVSGSDEETSESSSPSSSSDEKKEDVKSSDSEDDTKRSRKTSSGKASPEGLEGRTILSNLQGDRRLVIDFECFGSKGDLPQKFGKSGLLIPDGLVGTHTVYQERWRFEIHHTTQSVPTSDAVCITWKITNIKSGFTLAKTEAPDEAEARVSLGWTISSRLFREAMTHRANELETMLAGETNECRIANLKSLIKALRPKTFTQGPLVFGLKHRIVQEKIGNTLI